MSAAENTFKGLFVTGTDTGVGKTTVAAALARFLVLRGLKVGVMKPVESGVPDPSQPGPDAALLQWASGCKAADTLVAPYRLREPLAPSLAAQREKTFIDYSALLSVARGLGTSHDFVIVEGAGGLMTPLCGGLLMADLARELALPLFVVTTPCLGTINHTMLTIYAARQMEIPVAGYLINRMPNPPDIAAESAPHALASLVSASILGVLPEVQGDDREKVMSLSSELAKLTTLPWLLSGIGLD